MIGFILLLIGIFIAGIPVGITAIVHSSRVKGKPKAFLLPLSIIALVITIFTFGYAFVPDSSTTAKTVLYLSALAVSITTLSVAVHYKRKENNKVFDDKKREHEESVMRTNNRIEYYEEIKELKELLDKGAITQEEYDAKKTEILNRK